MKYKNIAASLGWTEEPDTEEGLFLQPEEATAIDAAIANLATAEQASTDLTAANARVSELTTELGTATTNLATANSRIEELEAENIRLGAQSSGTGTVLTTTEDPAVEKNATPSYLSDNNPANEWLDKKLKRK